MFCIYCRAVNPTEAVYCSACGRKIQSASESISGEQITQPMTGEIPDPKSDELRNEKGERPSLGCRHRCNP